MRKHILLPILVLVFALAAATALWARPMAGGHRTRNMTCTMPAQKASNCCVQEKLCCQKQEACCKAQHVAACKQCTNDCCKNECKCTDCAKCCQSQQSTKRHEHAANCCTSGEHKSQHRAHREGHRHF